MYRSILFVLAAAACGGGEPVTVVTFNAGLAPGFVDGAASRTAPVTAAVDALDADVVCLQEVWLPSDVAAIKAGTASFPYQDWPEGTQDTLSDPGCTSDELDRVVGCVEDKCDGVCDEYTDDCMLGNCAVSFINSSSSCQGCVMANVGGSAQSVRDNCSTGYAQYAFNGSFGTGLLSKHKIISSEHLELDATTNRRGVQHAVIDSPAGKIDVYCTHLTAVFELLPYPRESGDWDVEQRAQASALIDFVESSAETKRIVVLGDFNTGAAVGDDVLAVEIDTYDRFMNAGYSDPYTDQPGSCTWCGDNPLVSGERNYILDHVFVKGFDGSPTTERVLDSAQDIEVCEETAEGALSDHYGISATLVP
jgi:endonuclease/exonuclease/phosphatase family metal-dependent hydrolase